MSTLTPIPFSLESGGYVRGNWASFPFIRGGVPYESDQWGHAAPRCGLSLKSAGSMRCRLDEENPRRADFFSSIKIPYHLVVSPQLVHSLTAYLVPYPSASFKKEGDGVMTCNPAVVPCVTAADCMPIYLHDPVTGAFGVLHSGWKGTGIVESAVKDMKKKWGTNPCDVLCVLGPHIRDCCYTVDAERAEYFASHFSPDCVTRLDTDSRWPYLLSLEKANLAVLERLGVTDVAVCTDCTSCTPFLGSSRRETSGTGSSFTCMAAFAWSPDLSRSYEEREENN